MEILDGQFSQKGAKVQYLDFFLGDVCFEIWNFCVHLLFD